MKQSLRHALRALSVAPDADEPLRRDLEGLWKYRVRRFRIVYAIDHDHQRIRIVAVSHRREIYEEAAEQLRLPKPLQ
jgi:mRNA interferase RelE/StbE